MELAAAVNSPFGVPPSGALPSLPPEGGTPNGIPRARQSPEWHRRRCPSFVSRPLPACVPPAAADVRPNVGASLADARGIPFGTKNCVGAGKRRPYDSREEVNCAAMDGLQVTSRSRHEPVAVEVAAAAKTGHHFLRQATRGSIVTPPPSDCASLGRSFSLAIHPLRA